MLLNCCIFLNKYNVVMAQDFRIVFMGTPDFAVPALKKLIEAGFQIVGVVTAPDKPSGRGQKLKSTPVKKVAEAHEIPVLQPENLKDPQFLSDLEALKPDLQVVVAFRKLPEVVWQLPPQGTFNLHASLLPDYRGAAPIHWAIINGENETGVTTFFLQQEIDMGSMIFQDKIMIGENQTAGEVHDQLSDTGADLVVKTTRAIYEGNAPVQPQPETGEGKKAPKIFKDDCQIDWQKPLSELHNFIRGLSPFPGAWTYFDGEIFKILRTEKIPESHNEQPGKVFSDQRHYLHVAVNGGYLALKEVKLAGKQKMDTQAFLNGVEVPPDLVLGH